MALPIIIEDKVDKIGIRGLSKDKSPAARQKGSLPVSFWHPRGDRGQERLMTVRDRSRSFPQTKNKGYLPPSCTLSYLSSSGIKDSPDFICPLLQQIWEWLIFSFF